MTEVRLPCGTCGGRDSAECRKCRGSGLAEPPRLVGGGYWVTLGDGSGFPAPRYSYDLEGRLRHGQLQKNDLSAAASYLNAYRALIAATARRRANVVRAIRAADVEPEDEDGSKQAVGPQSGEKGAERG